MYGAKATVKPTVLCSYCIFLAFFIFSGAAGSSVHSVSNIPINAQT